MNFDRSQILACAEAIRDLSAKAGIDATVIRKGVRVTTHKLSPFIVPAAAVQIGADLIAEYDRDSLEQALIIVCS